MKTESETEGNLNMPKGCPADRTAIFSAITSKYGKIEQITRQQLVDLCQEHDDLIFPQWLTNDPTRRLSRGVYSLDDMPGVPLAKPVATPNPVATAEFITTADNTSFLPQAFPGYVPFGNYNHLKKIIESKKFYTVFVTGLSGNGKTLMVEQICANVGRECVRANITVEIDEDSLIGSLSLVNGSTVWQDGPVLIAMTRGAVLLLDEVDLGSNKMLCLQPVLEGRPVFVKKLGKVIYPKAGFNVVATANTKGQGSDDGRFIGTNVLNEAFLERFSVTMEQEYPSAKVEQKILNNVLAEAGHQEPQFVEYLVTWADIVRKSFAEGVSNDIISTRRLVHICNAFAIFGDRELAINLCLDRFIKRTKNGFMDLYNKIDPSVGTQSNDETAVVIEMPQAMAA